VKLPSTDQRAAVLRARQQAKMAASPHAFMRGSTRMFYAWLGQDGAAALPEGPPIWICGDCHVGNLGPLSDAAGRVGVQLRDFDQTVIGNPAHDLIRLALSLATAARGSSLPGIVTAQMVEHMIDAYARALTPGRARPNVQGTDEVDGLIKVANQRSWKHLARERIGDDALTIPLGRNFWPLAEAERTAIGRLFDQPDLIALARAIGARDDAGAGKVELMDAAYWVKGCSSLGLARYAVLLRIDGQTDCLIDIKQAVNSVAPRAPKTRLPSDSAVRVATGARALAPALGKRMSAQRLLGRAVFVRELKPQDLKLEIDQLSIADATRTARYLAHVVGTAHARQMDAPTRLSWQRELRRGRSKSLAAPGWLWRSMVSQIAEHESAYLDYCRRFALRGAR
jgi:uncharacterized protein (DUF2252 family)